MNHIQPDSFLTLHYRIAGPQGHVIIDTFDGPPATISLGCGQLSPAVERHLIGLPPGARHVVEMEPGQAFGPRQESLVQWVKRKLLDDMGDAQEVYTMGDVVQFPTPDGRGSYAGVVLEVRQDGAVLFDFNHPLAGQAVSVEVLIKGVL